MPAVERKHAVREWKEPKTSRGIFAPRCAATGKVWIDSTMNLSAANNGLFFVLCNGSHRGKMQ